MTEGQREVSPLLYPIPPALTQNSSQGEFKRGEAPKYYRASKRDVVPLTKHFPSPLKERGKGGEVEYKTIFPFPLSRGRG